MPALDCGLGQLSWKDVGPMMCYYLRQTNITSVIYLPMQEEVNSDYLSDDFLFSYKPKNI